MNKLVSIGFQMKYFIASLPTISMFCFSFVTISNTMCQRSVREINVCFFVGRSTLFVSPYICHSTVLNKHAY